MTTFAPARLAPDPALPQREMLLDEDVLAGRLSLLLGADGPVEISSVEIQGAKYRPGQSVRLALQVRAGGDAVTVGCRAFPPAAGPQPHRRLAGPPGPSGPFRSEVFDPVLNTLFWTFPRDPKIPGLAALAPNASGPATLGRVRHRLVRYVPEKRATAECIDPRGAIVAFVKAYSGKDDVRAARAHSVVERQLPSARPELRVPRLLAHLPDQGVIVVEAVPGQPLGGLSGADLARALRSLGVALATFHDLTPPPRPSGTPVAAGAAAEVVAVARPDLAAQARQLAAVLQSALPPAAPTACLHGDFHLGNALVDDDRASLLDIDHVCDGPAAHEIGETLARLCVWCLTGRVAPEDEVAGADAFREGYASARALPDPGAIRWHMARAFLARAEAGVKQLRPDLLGHLDELLAHGRAALEQTG